MAKIITAPELADIVRSILTGGDQFDEERQQTHFIEDLAGVLCNHLGGIPGTVSPAFGELNEYTVAIEPDESLPSDGGIWSRYDTDVTWKDGEEV